MPPDVDRPDLAVRHLADGASQWVGLHGWNGTHRTFAPLTAHLPDGVGLAGLDLPGYGDSAPPETWSLAAVGRRVADTLLHRDLTPCSLIGSCSGGVVGLFVADALGEALESFVFLEPFAYVPWYLGLLTIPVAGRLFYRLSFGTEIGRRIADSAMADAPDDTAMMESFARTDLEVPYRYLEMFANLERPEMFADLPGDIHLLYAERTFRAVRRSVEIWTDTWPDARNREFRGAGHLLLEDVPERIADYMARLRA